MALCIVVARLDQATRYPWPLAHPRNVGGHLSVADISFIFVYCTSEDFPYDHAFEDADRGRGGCRPHPPAGACAAPGRRGVSVTIQGREVRIPAAMVGALIAGAKLIAEGHAIDVIPSDEEISAQEAAERSRCPAPTF